MAEIVCDSNIWIALLNTTDSLNEKATKAIEEQEQRGNKFVINNYIDLECISVLVNRIDFKASQQWIAFRKKVDTIRTTCVREDDHQGIIELFLQLKNNHLSFTDISLIALAQQGFPILTFDQYLKRALKKMKLPLA